MTYRITLSDGSVLEGLRMNGNNFISTRPLSAETFAGKLGHVVIEATDTDAASLAGEWDWDFCGLGGTHANMELIQLEHKGGPLGGEWWFILADIPASRMREYQMRGDVDYLAMMTGVEL
ncbi:MAG: hypothetical protein IJP54_06275 [Synergistaceae bacterium]|nr:hypothetical protein [Synergistaceae bacterium]